MKRIILIFLILYFCSLLIMGTNSQFWGSWELVNKSNHIVIKISENNKVQLNINGKKIEKIHYEYFRPGKGAFTHLSIFWEGWQYGRFYLDLMPLNQDNEIEEEFLIGIFQTNEIVDDRKEIDETINYLVRFINVKRKKNIKALKWNNIGKLVF